MSNLVIVQPGQKLDALDAVAGDFSDWMLAGLGRADLNASNLLRVMPHLGERLPNPADTRAVIVTGSGSMVTERSDWMLDAMVWLRTLVEKGTPVLAICFGHQLLAQALGGEVADNPLGIEVGTVATILSDTALGKGVIDRTPDALFRDLPGSMQVQASHRQSVQRLPEGAVRLAASHQDPNHAFRVGERAWGVQFHPEFDARIVAAYVEHYRPQLEAQGVAVAPILQAVRPTPLTTGILERFGQLI